MTEHPSSGNAHAQQQSAADVPDAALIERILDTQIRPLLHIHGGDIRLVSLSARGDLGLEFDGACRACPLKTVTYAVAVRERLRQVPGVREIVVRGVGLSEAALKRVAAAYSGYALMFGDPADDLSRG